MLIQAITKVLWKTQSPSFVFGLSSQITPLFHPSNSHAVDLLVTFTCSLDPASAVTIALGGVHSWAWSLQHVLWLLE